MSATVIANLKAYLSDTQLKVWIREFVLGMQDSKESENSIIICPPVTHLLLFREQLDENDLSFISLGAQDISMYEQGAYTGEVTGSMVQEVADYVLLGHSERRKYHGETQEAVQKKIDIAQQYGLLPIVLMEKPEKHEGTIFAVGYEPGSSIGSGHPEPASEAYSVMKTIAKNYSDVLTIYGGSVDEKNVKEYLAHFDGVLVGTASEDPHEFVKVIQKTY
ncbi:MAG: triose-phosphate isomerase [Candidatus Roizmanbacteria bacterium]|nr:triose-phosphate isomerase [Candidatus Roizmanbacteria bacterium]